MGLSANGQNNQPEVIEVCESAIQSWCSFKNRSECSLMFRVMGKTPDTTSFFRMKVFNGTNKIQPNSPVPVHIDHPGTYEYFWFVSTAANSTLGSWYYDISLGIQELYGDGDLYVSVMDGRYPTETDYDYYSDMMGAD